MILYVNRNFLYGMKLFNLMYVCENLGIYVYVLEMNLIGML